MKGIPMIEKTIEVERMEHVISVFGSFDQNLRIIESELGVKVLDRDDRIHICGEAEDVMLAGTVAPARGRSLGEMAQWEKTWGGQPCPA